MSTTGQPSRTPDTAGGEPGPDWSSARTPAQLIPGNPAGLDALAARLRAGAGALEAQAARARSVQLDDWRGPAADQYRVFVGRLTKEWFAGSDSADSVASACTTLAHVQRWAQDQARDALALRAAADRLAPEDDTEPDTEAATEAGETVDAAAGAARAQAAADRAQAAEIVQRARAAQTAAEADFVRALAIQTPALDAPRLLSDATSTTAAGARPLGPLSDSFLTPLDSWPPAIGTHPTTSPAAHTTPPIHWPIIPTAPAARAAPAAALPPALLAPRVPGPPPSRVDRRAPTPAAPGTPPSGFPAGPTPSGVPTRAARPGNSPRTSAPDQSGPAYSPAPPAPTQPTPLATTSGPAATPLLLSPTGPAAATPAAPSWPTAPSSPAPGGVTGPAAGPVPISVPGITPGPGLVPLSPPTPLTPLAPPGTGLGTHTLAPLYPPGYDYPGHSLPGLEPRIEPTRGHWPTVPTPSTLAPGPGAPVGPPATGEHLSTPVVPPMPGPGELAPLTPPARRGITSPGPDPLDPDHLFPADPDPIIEHPHTPAPRPGTASNSPRAGGGVSAEHGGIGVGTGAAIGVGTAAAATAGVVITARRHRHIDPYPDTTATSPAGTRTRHRDADLIPPDGVVRHPDDSQPRHPHRATAHYAGDTAHAPADFTTDTDTASSDDEHPPTGPSPFGPIHHRPGPSAQPAAEPPIPYDDHDQPDNSKPDPHETTAVQPAAGPVAPVEIGTGPHGTVSVDLAYAPGLGLHGPGADAVARAVLVNALAASSPTADDASRGNDSQGGVFLPATSAAGLLGIHDGSAIPDQLHLFASTADVLATLERHHAHRAVQAPRQWPVLMLMLADPPADQAIAQRIVDLLTAAAPLGIVGVIVGASPPGAASVRLEMTEQGAIVIADATATHLIGTRPWALAPTEARDLIAELRPNAPDARTDDPPTEPNITYEPDPAGTAPSDTVSIDHDHDHAPATDHHASGNTDTDPEPVTAPLAAPHDGITTSGDTATAETTGTPALARVADKPTRADDSGSTALQLGTDHAPPDTNSGGWFELRLLGPVRAWWTTPTSEGNEPARTEILLAPRAAELLTYLAIHRGGARREAIADAIWGDTATSNHINTAIRRLRGVLAETAGDCARDAITNTPGRRALASDLFLVDLWECRDLINQTRTLTGLDLIAARHKALALAGGGLAEDVDARWLDVDRQDLTRELVRLAIDQADDLASSDPTRALQALDRARGLDPANEALARQAFRIQLHHGRPDAADRTRRAVIAELAKLGLKPTSETLNLFAAPARSRGRT